jgi:hypothetical protein
MFLTLYYIYKPIEINKDKLVRQHIVSMACAAEMKSRYPVVVERARLVGDAR